MSSDRVDLPVDGVWHVKVVGYACGWGPDVLEKANQDGKLFGDLIGEHHICF